MITTVGEERADFLPPITFDFLVVSNGREMPISLGASDRLQHLIRHSLGLPYNYVPIRH